MLGLGVSLGGACIRFFAVYALGLRVVILVWAQLVFLCAGPVTTDLSALTVLGLVAEAYTLVTDGYVYEVLHPDKSVADVDLTLPN